MARVDYTGVPDVSATVQAPDDYEHINASPSEFGAQIGEAVSELGQGAVQASKFYGQIAADNGYNNLLQQGTEILYGKPGQTVTGPDGQPTQDAGYFGRRGADAMSAREATTAALDQAIRQNGDSLKTPLARHQYETDSRRLRSLWMEKVGAHADEQQKTWAQDTNTTAATLALNDLGRAPLDPTTVQDASQRLTKAMVRSAQLAGLDPSGAVLKAQQEAAMTRIRSLVVSDPKNAQAVLDQNKGLLGSLPNYDQVSRQVKEADINAEFAPSVDAFTASAVASVRPQVGAPPAGNPAASDISRAIGAQEWRGKGPAPTSVNGAVGPSQIKPETAREYGLDPTRLKDPAYAAHARDVIVSKIAALPNVQGDPARIAVGYFSGPGNIAPAGSPTPYLHDHADGNGKKTSSYVSDVLGRLQRYPSTADALNANTDHILQGAQTYAEQKWPNYPDVQERFVETVRRRVDQTVTQQHQQYEVDTHVVQQAMEQGHPISEDQLLATSPQVAAAWKSMQLNNPYGAMSVERMFDANAKGLARTFGTEAQTYVDRVLAPSTDPQRIGTPAGLYPFVGPGDDAALTNTGVTQLSKLMTARQGPQGEAFAAQARTFLDGAHSNLTFGAPGLQDEKGEQLYSKFLAVAVPALIQAQQSGKLASMLDPKSKDYLGNLAAPFMRTPAQMVSDRLAAAGQKAAVFGPGGLTPENLKIAVATGRIPRDEGVQLARWLGYIQGGASPGAAPPKPAAVAGLPILPPRPGESSDFVAGKYLPEGG